MQKKQGSLSQSLYSFKMAPQDTDNSKFTVQNKSH